MKGKKEMDFRFISCRTACFDMQRRKLEWDVSKIYKTVDSVSQMKVVLLFADLKIRTSRTSIETA